MGRGTEDRGTSTFVKVVLVAIGYTLYTYVPDKAQWRGAKVGSKSGSPSWNISTKIYF